ncbi:hypothetical protein J5X84_27365 [Streptosporangiaceae bacterium NEAU-GS5]|nr:hypothetical protein [Streptosporangiaceae bacterium NEAU-GS5]
MERPDFTVVADEAVDGLADRVAALPGGTDEEAAARLEAAVEADGVPVGTERGLRDTLQRAIARLRTRELVADLGEAAAAFEILALHVPPGGKAGVDVRRSTAAERRMTFKLFGFGFGGGRTMTAELNEGIAERGTCMRVVQQVTVRVRRFGGEGEDLVTTDVTGWGERRFVTAPGCPHCRAGDEPDPFEYDLLSDQADALDLRDYDTEVRRERVAVLEGVRRSEIGVDLPLLAGGAATAGFHLEQRTSLSCAVAYTFPPGRRFVPYRVYGDGAALPYWHVS